MKAFQTLILAAGRGSRLDELTDDKPKCFVKLKETPLLFRVLSELTTQLDNSVHIVTGYRAESFQFIKNINTILNPFWENTNMLSSLHRGLMNLEENKDLIILYSDVLIQEEHIKMVLNKLDEGSSFVCPSYTQWKALWKERMENPLNDLETFKVSEDKITEIGLKPKNYDDIQGQFMGLLGIKAHAIEKLSEHLEEFLSQKENQNLSTTEFIQWTIKEGELWEKININEGWLEIDSKTDLETYENLIKNKLKSHKFGLQNL